MTGTCKLCREIVTGAPVLEVGPARSKAEFMAFADAMRMHVGLRHKEQLQVYGGLLTMAAAYLATLFADCPLDDFRTGQESTRDFICGQIHDAQVVIAAGTPVQSPLVVG